MQKLKSAAANILMFGGTVFYLIIIYSIASNDEPRIIKYDCTIAEFHPDIPVEVREACRKIRHVTSV